VAPLEVSLEGVDLVGMPESLVPCVGNEYLWGRLESEKDKKEYECSD
jgi:hypothetical protein